MSAILILLCLIFLGSTGMYTYLNYKTKMNPRFLYIDNLIVIAITFFLIIAVYNHLFSSLIQILRFSFTLITAGILVIAIGYSLTMIRFWRTPKRKITAQENEMVSPADGNVIYIKKIEANNTPISIKNGHLSELSELTKTTLLNGPCWLVGINMTPWDVHKNCAPIRGEIILNKHTKGTFLSLKKFDSETLNERNTYVIEGNNIRVGVVQIASMGVRRIDSYVKENTMVNKGDWLGMIRFGSQVDVIIPATAIIRTALGEQIYAGKTIIATI